MDHIRTKIFINLKFFSWSLAKIITINETIMITEVIIIMLKIIYFLYANVLIGCHRYIDIICLISTQLEGLPWSVEFREILQRHHGAEHRRRTQKCRNAQSVHTMESFSTRKSPTAEAGIELSIDSRAVN